jgi:hypothetical protein
MVLAHPERLSVNDEGAALPRSNRSNIAGRIEQNDPLAWSGGVRPGLPVYDQIESECERPVAREVSRIFS